MKRLRVLPMGIIAVMTDEDYVAYKKREPLAVVLCAMVAFVLVVLIRGAL
tara:strand:+ start:2173 stop:2322 length:150 start_codon:yes stop_codon:yes gene_type:complete